MRCNNSYDKDSSKSKPFKSSTGNSIQHDDNHIKSSKAIVPTLPVNSIKIKEEYK
jgi:hypothetical protein